MGEEMDRELFYVSEDGTYVPFSAIKEVAPAYAEEYGFDPSDLLNMEFSISLRLKHSDERKIRKEVHRLHNRLRRFERSLKRAVEKERRKRLKEGANGSQAGKNPD